MMENITVQKITPDDIFRLQTIARQTFTETFSSTNTPENMSRYLEESFSIEKLSAEISDTNSVFYLAQTGNEMIGYLKLNSGCSQTDIKDDKSLEIERIYVLKEFHGRKVAQKLYEKALQVANEMDADYIWLGVWEENPRAIRFYQKNGFVEFDKHIFRLGDDEQTDILMKLPLKQEL